MTYKAKGAPQKPALTESVISGIGALLDHVPASAIQTKDDYAALRYLRELVAYCQSDHYKTKRAVGNEKVRAYKAATREAAGLPPVESGKRGRKRGRP